MAYQKLTPEQIEQIAREQGVSPSLVNAVINQESKGNPEAISSKGATGLMQIMPTTAPDIAKNLGYSNYDLKDPKTNVTMGSNYLAQMQKKYGDERLALAAYNSGPGKIDELQAQYGKEYEKIAPHLYSETSNYVPSVQSQDAQSQDAQSQGKTSDVLLSAAKKKGQDYAVDKGKEALLGNAATTGTNAFSATANGATMFSGGSTVGGTTVGSAANGGTLMSTGEIVPASAGEAVGSAGAAEAAGGVTAGQVLGGAAAAYGAYKTAQYTGDAPSGGERNKNSAMSGAASGAALGASIGGPWGALIGGALGGVAGFVGSEFGSNKDKDQMARDAVRKSMIDQKIIGNDYSLMRADGSSYDIGRDGNAKLLNSDGKTSRQAFDVDFTNPLAAETTAQSMALGMILTGGHKKLSDDFTGYITNAGLSNAKDQTTATQNLQAITKQMMGSGLTQDSAKSILDQLKSNNRIDVNSYNVAVSKLPILFGTSQPITAVGAAAQKKGGGSPEIAIQGPTPTVSPQLNPHLRTAVKNTSSEPAQSQAGAFRR